MKNLYFSFKAIMFLMLLGLFVPENVLGQTKITGKVTDETQLPLPGVSVMLKGTNLGTTTQADGTYSLSAQPGQTLVFRFLGSETQEVLVSSQTIINILLKSDSKALSEVVVTASGIKKEVKKLTYAVQESAGQRQSPASTSIIRHRRQQAHGGLALNH